LIDGALPDDILLRCGPSAASSPATILEASMEQRTDPNRPSRRSDRQAGRAAAGILILLSCAAPCLAQSIARGYGEIVFDFAYSTRPAIDISAGTYYALAAHADGSSSAWGSNQWGRCNVPPLTAGLAYVEIAAGDRHGLARRSDGSVVAFGDNTVGQCNVPPLPPGLAFAEVAAGGGSGFWGHSVARRSDGSVVVWGDNLYGQHAVPPLPSGVTYTQIAAGSAFTIALRSDGNAVAWGDNFYGQCNVTAPPPGTTWVRVAAGYLHTLALRSDGVVAGFGANLYGQCTAPPGTTYVEIAAGGNHSVALRSDGVVVDFGTNLGASAPALPPGLLWAQLACSNNFSVGRRSDGAIFVWPETILPSPHQNAPFAQVAAGGFDNNATRIALRRSDGSLSVAVESPPVPPLPAGLAYEEVALGNGHALARRSDGSVVAWGSNVYGELTVPWLPPGMTWVEIAAGMSHSLGRTSTGLVLAWGSNFQGQCDVPGLPAACVEIAAGAVHGLARLADGQILAWGDNSYGQCSVPPLPAGLTWIQIAAGHFHSLGRRSDGAILAWGDNTYGQGNVPPLPPGVVWVDLGAGSGARHSIARRSDGTVAAWGRNDFGQCDIPSPGPGLAYVEVAVSHKQSIVRLGPPSSYVRLGTGCAGSMAATRLVPLDTPRIGAVLEVALDNLPADLAVLFTGLSTTSSRFGPLPLELSVLGMPGCAAYVSDDAVTVVAGSGNRARFTLAIPNAPNLVGLPFHQQALVLDPGAGNALGAVLSDAATAVVGA
jgi:alpha-tubulin suppressor-like RCC1 family protein